MESKDELEKIDIKNCACYQFEDIIREFDINFDNILLDKNYMKKSFVLRVVLIIILERSEMIHIILYLLKKYSLFIM